MKHKAFTAETGKVEGEVVWDETKCDACKVCVEACPEECSTVEREVESDKIEGQVDIDQKMCCTCTWCSRSCPTEAITVEKLFEGDIEFFPEKCPGGCSTCVEICPANAIYLPSSVPASQLKGKVERTIAVNKDFCILCGACVNACPGEDIIPLHKTGIRVNFRYEWLGIPHLYHTPFYCYAYSFGQLLSMSLYHRYKREGVAFGREFLTILSAGGSLPPAEILRQAGIDIADREFWRGGFRAIEHMISVLEQ